MRPPPPLYFVPILSSDLFALNPKIVFPLNKHATAYMSRYFWYVEYLALFLALTMELIFYFFAFQPFTPPALCNQTIFEPFFISQIREEGFRFQKRYKTWKLVLFYFYEIQVFLGI